MDEPSRRFAAMMFGLDIHYDLGEGHPLLGRRMPDLDLVTANGPLRVFTLLHDARPVLLNLGEPGGFDITPWADRVQLVDAKYVGTWELPALGPVTAPTAVLIRPDGYVAWVGDLTQLGLADALTTWFGPPFLEGTRLDPFNAGAPGRRDKTYVCFAIPATRRLGVDTRKRKGPSHRASRRCLRRRSSPDIRRWRATPACQTSWMPQYNPS